MKRTLEVLVRTLAEVASSIVAAVKAATADDAGKPGADKVG